MNHSKATTAKLQVIALAVLLGASATALADHDVDRHAAQHQIVYGKVIDVTPIYRQVKVSNPVKECWSEPVTRSRNVYHGGNTAGSTLAGGIIGGIIGHQFGKGRGKKLATAVGTIVGAQIGHDSARGAHGSSTEYIAYQDVCEVEQHVSYEQVLDSYQVSYKYRGNRYRTVLPYDPGKRIKLKVSVEPVI